jgi:hypothetical protein
MNNKNKKFHSFPPDLTGREKGQPSIVRNEKGIALVMILILASIALLIMAGLLYMITSSTQISGMQKRYKSGLEAGIGGAEIAYQFIALRGDNPASLITLLSSINPVITTPTACVGTGDFSALPPGLATKLMAPTTSWGTSCNSTMSIDPSIACTSTSCSYDMQFELGTSPDQYRVYAKLVDTVEGNSAPDYGLGGKGVVVSGSSEVVVVSMPYLYTMEMDAQNTVNPSERAKLSILYQY